MTGLLPAHQSSSCWAAEIRAYVLGGISSCNIESITKCWSTKVRQRCTWEELSASLTRAWLPRHIQKLIDFKRIEILSIRAVCSEDFIRALWPFWPPCLWESNCHSFYTVQEQSMSYQDLHKNYWMLNILTNSRKEGFWFEIIHGQNSSALHHWYFLGVCCFIFVCLEYVYV